MKTCAFACSAMSIYGRHTVYTDRYSQSRNELLPIISHNRPNCSVTLGTAQHKDSIAEFTNTWGKLMQDRVTFAKASDLHKVKYNYDYLPEQQKNKRLKRILSMWLKTETVKGQKFWSDGVNKNELFFNQKEDANFFAYLVTGCFIELLNTGKEQDNDNSRIKIESGCTILSSLPSKC